MNEKFQHREGLISCWSTDIFQEILSELFVRRLGAMKGEV